MECWRCPTHVQLQAEAALSFVLSPIKLLRSFCQLFPLLESAA